jgi:hypothetical protein
MQPSHEPKPPPQGMSIWTHDQARRAIPYIHALMSSLREHRLEELGQHIHAQRLSKTTSALKTRERELALGLARAAEVSFQEDFEELQSLSIYPLNAIQGVALLPFVHDSHLAWMIFDLFDDDPLRCWRYHDDPPQAVRLIEDAETDPRR